MKKLLSLVLLSASLYASSGKALFEQKCTSCHSIKQPASYEEVKQQLAPPIGNVLFHLGKSFKTPEEIKAHINDFVLNPTKEKAICRSVKRFGLMPSMKGSITKEELNTISTFLTDLVVYMQSVSGNKKGCGGGCGGGACSTKK